MIDLNSVTDKLGELTQADGISQMLGRDGLDPTQLQDMVAQLGIDPADLAGMAPEDILNTLSEHGVDLSQLGETDLQGIVEQLSGGQLGDIATLAQDAVSNGGVGELIQSAFSRFLGK
ncbi:MAG: hypothetical protein AAFU66_08460 [Pseudomonadota bacterium]